MQKPKEKLVTIDRMERLEMKCKYIHLTINSCQSKENVLNDHSHTQNYKQ